MRVVSPPVASSQITMNYTNELGRRQRDINALPDPEELANLDPQEVLARMNAAIDAQADRLEAVEADMDAEFAHTRNFGAIAVSGSTIEFEGSDTRVIRGDQVEAFADVAGAPVRVVADCAD